MNAEEVYIMNDKIIVTPTVFPSKKTLSVIEKKFKEEDYYSYLLWLEYNLPLEEKQENKYAIDEIRNKLVSYYDFNF